MSIGVSFNGQWQKLEKDLNKLSTKGFKLMGREVEKFSSKLAGKVAKGLLHGTTKLEKLKESTIKSKKSDLPLVDTGILAGSIKAIQMDDKNWLIGINRQETYGEDGKVAKIASIQFFGWPERNIEARDPITPVLEENADSLMEALKKVVEDNLHG